MDPVTKGKKYMEFKASKDAVSWNFIPSAVSFNSINVNAKKILFQHNSAVQFFLMWKKLL